MTDRARLRLQIEDAIRFVGLTGSLNDVSLPFAAETAPQQIPMTRQQRRWIARKGQS